MENYPEWSDIKRLIDLRNKFCTLYQNDDNSMFYIEPLYYQNLQFFKEFAPNKYNLILEEMQHQVKLNKLVVFTGNEEEPLTIIDSNIKAVYLTIEDITERVGITNEPKHYQTDYTD